MNERELVVRGYSLTREEIEILERVSNERSLFNLSAALRQIIREWNERAGNSKAQNPIPDGQLELPIEKK